MATGQAFESAWTPRAGRCRLLTVPGCVLVGGILWAALWSTGFPSRGHRTFCMQPRRSLARSPRRGPLSGHFQFDERRQTSGQDSVDVPAGVVSPCVLTVDQGMIMAAIGNELTEDEMRHAFSDGRNEQSVRPTIATEEFAVGSTCPEHRGASDG